MKRLLAWALGLLLAVAALAQYGCQGGDSVIYIGYAGPLSGPGAADGRAARRATQLYIEEVNRDGRVGGRELALRVFDDANDPARARQVAQEIVAEDRVLAVVGHSSSASSIAAGEVYRAAGISALTAASTRVELTRDNEWYFRNIFNDDFQGQFLANYAAKALRPQAVWVLHDEGAYGVDLARVFVQTAAEIGLEIEQQRSFPALGQERDRALEQIVGALRQQAGDALIFLAAQPLAGVELVRRIRDAGLNNQLLGVDSFAVESFRQGFADLPKERDNPGYYTNGLYATVPLLFDSANERANDFSQAFEARYAEPPNWGAAYAYDAAALVVEALRRAGIEGAAATRSADRTALRDYLASLTEASRGVAEVTGLNYFDENGDALKAAAVGVYKNRRLIAAPIQFQMLSDLGEAARLDASFDMGRVVAADYNYLYQTNVVHVGMRGVELSGT